ncbi:MAG TPA: hypothetical protein VFR23_24455 [Jiangellaceae bacterium]|nr:hypothetical protein [Jiangellaceae bacterium]
MAIAARRAKQEPEFYGTMPDPLPETLPDGTQFGSLPLEFTGSAQLCVAITGKPFYRGLFRRVGSELPGTTGVWYAEDLDWSRIPRQTTATITERANHGLGFDGPRECADCGQPIERFQECSRAALGSDGILRPVPGFFHAKCPTGETKKAPDPYAAVRENERAATVNTLALDLERRRTGKIAALRLDLDRPSGKARHAEAPSTWPSQFSGASWEDD